MTGVLRLADSAALERPAWRTRFVRVSLALLLIAVVALAVLAGRHPSSTTVPYLPRGANGIVVLDLSASISTDTYAEIGSTLSKLAASGGRYGLVVFSSDAYEALPPETPARELQPFVRFFRVHVPGPGFAPVFPVNPWMQSFSEGTSISRALDLARTIVARRGLRRAALLLVSDLDDDPGDLRRIGASALSLRRAHIPVHVVALSASSADQALFARLFPGHGTIEAASTTVPPSISARTPTPVWLIAAALAAALLLAAAELLAPVLRFPVGASS